MSKRHNQDKYMLKSPHKAPHQNVMNEKEFLKNYDISEFETPLLSVDTVLFTYHETHLKVLLVKRGQHPDKDKWGLPGGFVDQRKDADLKATATRKVTEKTAVTPAYLEQLETFGNAKRDKRGWSVTVCYSALIAHQNCKRTMDSVSDVKWVKMNKLEKKEIAFDHKKIISAARERLRQKALYSIVPAYALPDEFTLPELQHLHELLIGKSIQKKSFRRRIEQADLLIDTGRKRSEGGRPASLYKLKKGTSSFNFIRNLEE